MFGKNEIVGRKWFREKNEHSEGKLLITSMFYTLQGEGPYSGTPAIFIRLAKCNLACSFCDTFFDDGDWYLPENLIEEIEKLIPEIVSKKSIGIVLTGGEPLLQENLKELISLLHNAGYKYVQIESNGIPPLEVPDYVTLVISPKCSEKNGASVKYMKPNAANLERADCLKFVMSAPNEIYSPYQEVPDWALEWKRDSGKEVFVSPMNIYNEEPQKSKEARNTKNRLEIEERSTVDEVISFWEEGLLNLKENEKNHKHTARYCMENGLRLSIQQHLYAGLA